MKKEMKDEMVEGFTDERMAREQAQKEMRSEIRSEMEIIKKENWKSLKEEAQVQFAVRWAPRRGLV